MGPAPTAQHESRHHCTHQADGFLSLWGTTERHCPCFCRHVNCPLPSPPATQVSLLETRSFCDCSTQESVSSILVMDVLGWGGGGGFGHSHSLLFFLERHVFILHISLRTKSASLMCSLPFRKIKIMNVFPLKHFRLERE